eukprot:COSAG04_NODE_28146_length_277_cov_1.067416_1_plen_51_part_01
MREVFWENKEAWIDTHSCCPQRLGPLLLGEERRARGLSVIIRIHLGLLLPV